jgi:hypothetical protein
MLPSGLPTAPLPVQYAFVVQFAAGTPRDSINMTGRVEHIASGQAMRFQTVAALVAFMIERLHTVLTPSAPEDTAPARSAAEQA